MDMPEIEAEIGFERELFSRLQMHVFKLHEPLSYLPTLQWGTSSLNASVSMDPLNYSNSQTNSRDSGDAIKAGGHLRRHQTNSAVPLDVLCEIVDFIQIQDLFCSALVNWLWNGLVNRRLWRCFRLHTGGSTSVTTLHDRLDALVRLPSRVRCIHRLIIGPITWQWDAELLQKMIYLWTAMPFLSELTFDVPHTNPDVSRGGEFAPVLRGLLLHGSHLRLHSFTYSHYMTPNSALERFLMAQPSIRTLSGICSRWKTFPAITPAFFPELRVISCGPELTALLAPSHRPKLHCKRADR